MTRYSVFSVAINIKDIIELSVGKKIHINYILSKKLTRLLFGQIKLSYWEMIHAETMDLR